RERDYPPVFDMAMWTSLHDLLIGFSTHDKSNVPNLEPILAEKLECGFKKGKNYFGIERMVLTLRSDMKMPLNIHTWHACVCAKGGNNQETREVFGKMHRTLAN
ncbi:hypothetical protein KI387_014626, partial [Taxus chinensis]